MKGKHNKIRAGITDEIVKPLHILVDKTIYDQLVSISKKQNCSLAYITRQAIKEYLNKKDNSY